MGDSEMPASIAHFVNLIETYHSLKSGNENIFEAEPVKKKELRQAKADDGVETTHDYNSGIGLHRDEDRLEALIEGKSDKGISQYAYLGAIFPDLPYFNDKTEFASNLFHYSLSGNFAIKLIDLAKARVREGDTYGNILMAFTIGFISHIAADVVCHPYVNTIAGSYWNQGIPLIAKPMGKVVHLHMRTETYQDSWLANKYFGLDDITSTRGNSWDDFISELSLGFSKLRRMSKMELLINDICRIFQEVYGATLDEKAVWTAGNRLNFVIWSTFNKAVFPIPKKPSMNLVNYPMRKHDYWYYLQKAFSLTEKLSQQALNYYQCAPEQDEAELKELKKWLKNWNLDMGYCYYVYITPNETTGESDIHIRCEHSWCHNYGLAHSSE
jgi:hypothetical protein